MQLYYHWHSFIQIQSDSTRILVDPFVTGNRLCDTSIDDLIKTTIDAIIITHGYGDHVGDTLALAAAHPQAIVISTNPVIRRLQSQGMTNPTHGPSIWWSVTLDQFSVKLTPAIHDWHIMQTEQYSQPAGIIITIDGKKIYHAGDTWLTMDLQLVKQWGPIDVAFLPIWDYYTMGVADAVTACGWIMPTTVVPIHYNTFPQIKADPIEFARLVMLNKFAVPKVLTAGQYVVM
jgi:L-ascorbate metabolism protein UlaG (beta-lactamase superfamily)